MCGRFFVDAKNREIDRLLEALPPCSPAVRLGEVFPTQIALTLILKNQRIMPMAMSWGFPRRDGKGSIINARAESALNKPMFSKALRHNPLVVPVTGFYEWKSASGQKRKEKFLFSPADSSLLYLAGFWSEFEDDQGIISPHFTILTCDADAFMREWHDRMPVTIQASELKTWLEGKNRQEFLDRCVSALAVIKD